MGKKKRPFRVRSVAHSSAVRMAQNEISAAAGPTKRPQLSRNKATCKMPPPNTKVSVCAIRALDGSRSPTQSQHWIFMTQNTISNKTACGNQHNCLLYQRLAGWHHQTHKTRLASSRLAVGGSWNVLVIELRPVSSASSLRNSHLPSCATHTLDAPGPNPQTPVSARPAAPNPAHQQPPTSHHLK